MSMSGFTFRTPRSTADRAECGGRKRDGRQLRQKRRIQLRRKEPGGKATEAEAHDTAAAEIAGWQ